MSQPDRIAAALSHGALTVAEISAATGLSRNAIRAVLSRYAGRRWVKIQEGEYAGRWGLLAVL